jgi:hypothetical protein
MSNLLPEKTKQKIHAEYRARFVLTASSLAIGAAAFTALVLSPSFGVLYVSRSSSIEKASQAHQMKTDNDDILRAQSLLSQVSNVALASSSISSAIIDALAQKSDTVSIDTISYVTTSASPSIALGGVAQNRASLEKFRTQLQGDPRFTSVNIPVADLLGSQGSRFTVTLKGHF